MTDIATNLVRIRERITIACQKVKRDPNEVRLIAVSKIKPAEDIERAYRAGQHLFGESYVQEFCDKQPLVKEAVSWHFIGGLQSNKVKYLRGKVEMIHSVDRLSLAREIDRQWGKIKQPVKILIQVNVGAEENKSGCKINELGPLVRQVSALPHLAVQGLMCLPPFFEDPEQVRPYFRKLRQLAQDLEQQSIPNVSLHELSMGMSGDFEVAVEEGATLVRIGTAIFGARVKKT